MLYPGRASLHIITDVGNYPGQIQGCMGALLNFVNACMASVEVR